MVNTHIAYRRSKTLRCLWRDRYCKWIVTPEKPVKSGAEGATYKAMALYRNLSGKRTENRLVSIYFVMVSRTPTSLQVGVFYWRT